MAKRSLFKMIFGRWRPQADTQFTQMQTLTEYLPAFSKFTGDPYSADIVRGAVDAIARNAAKLKPKHIKRTGGDITLLSDQIEQVLQVRPNPLMSTYDFIYKMVTALMINNNAYAWPEWEGAKLKAVWPIVGGQPEYLEDNLGHIAIRFWFQGQSVVLPYEEVIHLRRFFFRHELTGAGNGPLKTTLEVIHVTSEGLAQAVKTSAHLRGLLKFAGVLNEADIKKNRDRFVGEFLSVQNTGGIAALDNKAEYVELNSNPKMIDAEQMKELRDSIYRYFGINSNIIMGDYTEQQWDAFYESTIEPIAVQMSLEFTAKLFTPRERGIGHEIIFEANRLQYASAKTKVAMIKQLVPMGVMSLNESREILNLAPIEGGDKRIISLNYVDADKANQYQLGEGVEPIDPKPEAEPVA